MKLGDSKNITWHHVARECQGQDLPLCVKPRRFALRVLAIVGSYCEALRSCDEVEGKEGKRKFNGKFYSVLLSSTYTVLAFWVCSDRAQAWDQFQRVSTKPSLDVTMVHHMGSLFPGALVVVDPGLG